MLQTATCNVQQHGGLAQLARAPALHAGGHRFDSDILHNSERKKVHWHIAIKNKVEKYRKHKGAVYINTVQKYNKQNKGVWGMPVALRGEEGRDKLR